MMYELTSPSCALLSSVDDLLRLRVPIAGVWTFHLGLTSHNLQNTAAFLLFYWKSVAVFSIPVAGGILEKSLFWLQSSSQEFMIVCHSAKSANPASDKERVRVVFTDEWHQEFVVCQKSGSTWAKIFPEMFPGPHMCVVFVHTCSTHLSVVCSGARVRTASARSSLTEGLLQWAVL